jgi:prepilin-type N-terminal cleavage/methylation domain-containing protein
MMETFHKKVHQSGFSLVELMVVVAIIGVLSSLAVPRFKVFQAKSRQAEAKANLSHIYTLEQSYLGDNDKYVSLVNACSNNDLGFTLDCSAARYDYTVTATATTFVATATGKKDLIRSGCTQQDIWVINELKQLKPKTPANDLTKSCSK